MDQTHHALFRTRWVCYPDGERFVFLLGANGVPIAPVCLFLTTQYRNTGRTPNTMESAVSALKILYGWTDANDIYLHQRFMGRKFLDSREIDGLIRTLSIAVRQPQKPKVVRLPRAGRGAEGARAAPVKSLKQVSLATVENRLVYVSSYLSWLANHQLAESRSVVTGQDLQAIKEMMWAINARTPAVARPSRVRTREGLSQAEQAELLALLEPGAANNPFEPRVQCRNYVAMRLLELGLRMGELLSLKVTDFDFQMNEVVVPRRHDDPEDPRC